MDHGDAVTASATEQKPPNTEVRGPQRDTDTQIVTQVGQHLSSADYIIMKASSECEYLIIYTQWR